MKFLVKKKFWRKQKYYFEIESDNGKILCSSGGYYNSKDILGAIDSIKKKISKADVEITFDTFYED